MPDIAIEMCFKDGLFSDWTIISEDGKKFPCHRIILAAKSSYFKTMLTTQMKVESETKVQYRNEVVGAFVCYFYKGEVPSEVLEDNLSIFFELSEFYDLQPMKAQVENSAINCLNTENAVEMFSMANFYNSQTLKDASNLFIIEKIQDLAEQQITYRILEEIYTLCMMIENMRQLELDNLFGFSFSDVIKVSERERQTGKSSDRRCTGGATLQRPCNHDQQGYYNMTLRRPWRYFEALDYIENDLACRLKHMFSWIKII